MNAKELRLGNWVCVDDDGYGNRIEIQITWIDPDEHGEIMSGISAIPLTQDWLEKFGFEYDEYFELWGLNPKFTDMGGVGSVSYDFRLHVVNGQFVFSWGDGELIVEYVHQLQNLYFILKGKEL